VIFIWYRLVGICHLDSKPVFKCGHTIEKEKEEEEGRGTEKREKKYAGGHFPTPSRTTTRPNGRCYDDSYV
jgi:hypothetical protein